MSTAPRIPASIVCIDDLRARREARERAAGTWDERARNQAATDAAIIVDRIRADLVRLRRLTDAETVSRFLTGRITALGGPEEGL